MGGASRSWCFSRRRAGRRPPPLCRSASPPNNLLTDHETSPVVMIDRSLTAVIGLWCAGLAWVLSSPVWMAAINWDQGAYIAKAAAPGGHWSDAPWNAHYAIGHVYEVGVFLARL